MGIRGEGGAQHAVEHTKRHPGLHRCQPSQRLVMDAICDSAAQGVFRQGSKHRSGPSTPSCQTSISNGYTTPGSDQTPPEPTLEQKILAAQVALKCADLGTIEPITNESFFPESWVPGMERPMLPDWCHGSVWMKSLSLRAPSAGRSSAISNLPYFALAMGSHCAA